MRTHVRNLTKTPDAAEKVYQPRHCVNSKYDEKYP